jgi:hypothetical protein
VPAGGEPGAAGAAVRVGGTGPAPIAVAWSAPAADTVPAADQPGAVVSAADAVAGSAAALSTRPSGSLPPECAVAAALAAGAPAGHAVPRFGASDCGCRGHLVYFGSLRELRSAVTAAAAHTNARMCRFGYPLGYTAAV